MLRSPTRFLAPLGVAAALTLVAPRAAHAGEYRQLTLADGRVLLAEIIATESAGLRVRTPQGENIVIFEVLADMLPIVEAKYLEQEDWTVVVTGDPEATAIVAPAYDAFPGIQVHGQEGSASPVSAAAAADLEKCAGNVSCIKKVSTNQKLPWLWVVHATPGEEGGYDFQGSVNTGTRTKNKTSAPSLDREAMYPALAEAIGLVPEKKAPKEYLGDDGGSGPSRAPTDMTREKVIGMSFAPVPGLPSLMQKDYGNFGIAMGAVIPATALWVGAVGKNAQSGGEFVALSVGGFYAATVAVNQALGMNSYNRNATVVQVEPARRGEGATVAVTVPLK